MMPPLVRIGVGGATDCSFGRLGCAPRRRRALAGDASARSSLREWLRVTRHAPRVRRQSAAS